MTMLSNQTSTVRRLVAGFLVLHGFAHFAGVSAGIRLLDEHGSASLLGGVWHPTGAAVLATFTLAWALAGLGFLATAGLLWVGEPAARPVLIGVTCFSLALGIASLWGAVVGVAIDLTLLGLLALAWLPGGAERARHEHE